MPRPASIGFGFCRATGIITPNNPMQVPMQIVEPMNSNHRACFRMQFSYKLHLDKHATGQARRRLYASVPHSGIHS